MKLTDYTSYADAQKHFSTDALWELFDGTEEKFNIAHECLDRHAHLEGPAIRIAHADGRDEAIGWAELAEASSRCAHQLREWGVRPGDTVAVLLEPSAAFYISLFGILKTGAGFLPLFTLFGPDAIRARVTDCGAKLILSTAEKRGAAGEAACAPVKVADAGWIAGLSRFPGTFAWTTESRDLAIIQYTSGTTRQMPQAIRQTHRSLVTLMVSSLYGVGLRPGDRYCCPSSAAWGHGLWQGTLAPMAIGVATTTYAGKFDPLRLLKALQDYRITTLSAAATHYRMMKNSGAVPQYKLCLGKISFAGEPLDTDTEDYIVQAVGAPMCSIYGTSEIGAVVVGYPGAPDLRVPRGSLGKPVPGVRMEVQDVEGRRCAPDEIGEMKVWRRGAWVPTRDLGFEDASGFLFHGGRADDVIISAGWTISPMEVEDIIQQHPDVRETAVVGLPDGLRGQIVKAFVVAARPGTLELVQEIQDLVRHRLGQHEYPRAVEFLPELPKTPAGKINRRLLRDRPQKEAA